MTVLLNVIVSPRLEELLLVYPPEEVEAKRFQKVANALGNRTPLQVHIVLICVAWFILK